MRDLSIWLLRVLLPRSDRGHVLAELEELHEVKSRREGRRSADLWLRRQAVGFAWRTLSTWRGLGRRSGRTGLQPNRPIRPRRPLLPLREIGREVRLAIRTLARARGFATLAIVSLALGLGAATAIFSITNALLIRPLPFHEPHRVVGLFYGEFGNHTYPNFLALREECEPFLELAAHDEFWFGEGADKPVFFRSGADATRISLGLVSEDYFQVMGIRPETGRFFVAEDNRTQGGNPVAVLSWSFWQRQYGGDRGVVDRELELSGTSFRVVGVAPEGFHGNSYLSATDVWIPAVMRRAIEPPEVDYDIVVEPGWQWISILGRLRPGVGIEEAQARLDAVIASSTQISESLREGGATLRPAYQGTVLLRVREQTAAYLRVLLLAAGLVVLVVCVNVTSLFMGRMEERAGEISVRRALGAGPGALARQYLVEAGVIAATGGGGALLLSLWLDAVFLRMIATGLPLSATAANLNPDFTVVAFAFGLVAVCTVIIAGVSVLRSRRNRISTFLRPGSGITSGPGGLFSFQNMMVIGQVTLSMVLLAGAGVMLRSFIELRSQDVGLDSSNLLMISVDNERVPLSPEEGSALYRKVLERIRALPEVDEASLAKVAPLSGSAWGGRVEVEGYEPEPGEYVHAAENYVDPTFFRTMGIELLAGRGFTGGDVAGGEPVVIVNESLVRRYWPGTEPLGKTIRARSSSPDLESYRVVGVVRDHFYSHMRRGAVPLTYYPISQHFLKNPTLLVRTRTPPLASLPPVREAVREIDPSLVLFDEVTMEARLREGVSRERVTTILLFAYAGLALLLAVIGTYGMVSRAVVRRRKEIGIRTALGARADEIVGLVLTTGMKVVVIGLVTGLVLAGFATRLLRSLVFGVETVDPPTFVAVGMLLLVAGAVACLLPAARALTADPVEVLREE